MLREDVNTIFRDTDFIDGTMTNTRHGAGNASYSENTLGLDGIQEYRVLTSSYGAEYGMRMGSQSIMVSKSGTNAFHGSAFEYFRDQSMKAKGMKINAIAPAEIVRMRDKVKPVTDKFVKEGGEALAKEMYDEINKVRSNKKS